jgi:two-component system, NtrC family, sensor histidine kinase HydH
MSLGVDQKLAPVGAREAAVAATMTLLGLTQWLIPPSQTAWLDVLPHLYCFPILYAGLEWGCKGGLAAAGFAMLVSIPHALAAGTPHVSSISQFLEIGVFCAAGALAGIRALRERERRRASEEKAKRLSSVYVELQEDFKQMSRADKLYALGQLSAGLAHELRNPLASIAGAAGILRRGRSSEAKQTECLEIIQKECQRLNRLLTSFLDFARPRALNFQTVQLESLFDSVLGLAEHVVDGAPITLRRQVEPDLSLECDPELLKQVLLNLIINAIQAMPNGGELAMSAAAEAGNAIIQVRDQGCGVSEEEMNHLYDPFFTTKENGTGLGLPIAHQIVVQLGGVLAARNNADSGMTFSVQLPLRAGATHEQ